MGICICTKKVKPISSSDETNIRITGRLTNLLYKCNSNSVDKLEISMLKEIYLDLSRKSESGVSIDKETFLEFFSLPVSIT